MNRNKLHTNVHIAESSSGSKYISSSEALTWKIGANYKVTLAICIGNAASLNFDLAGNYNGVENYNRFIVGVGVGDFGRLKEKKSIEKLERIIIR